MAKLALVLIFAGLGFKIAAVPFHFYAPDVYQGTTHANAALLSVVPKAAGLVALVRIVRAGHAGHGAPTPGGSAWCWPSLTMTFGNVLALWQDNLRRLLAYSSIAHAGYMLIGLAVGLATAGTAARPLGRRRRRCCSTCASTRWPRSARSPCWTTWAATAAVDAVDELAGLGRTRPLAAAVLAVFMFSLAGIPPLAGFWGKLAVFGSALNVEPAAGEPGGLRVVVRRPGGRRRAERGRGGGLLPADRGRDVLPHAAGHAQARGRPRRLAGRRGLRAAGRRLWACIPAR